MTEFVAIDDFDRKLLARVRRNNLEPARVTAEAVGLSESAVLRRLRRLRAEGVIVRDVAVIDPFTRELQGFSKADAVHFDALLHGCIELDADLDALIVPLLDRELGQISPIEHGCMWIGAYEFLKCPDVPWRVVLNECIELAKDFGGTDGHKYVNAVLNGLAPKLRPLEVEADRGKARADKA